MRNLAFITASSLLCACAMDMSTEKLTKEELAEQVVQEGAIEKSAWTSFWFSEENGGAVCPAGMSLNGMECSGNYCDNLRIRCRNDGDTFLGSDSYWTNFFSEEQGGGGCAGGYAVTGVWCSGSYCDNIQLRCTEVMYNYIDYCHSTNWFSEEGSGYAELSYPWDRVTYIGCSGNYCDNKYLYGCDYDF